MSYLVPRLDRFSRPGTVAAGVTLTHDYHVHSTYSDGDSLVAMLDAATEAGLDAVGFADHCSVSDRESMRRKRCELGFNLDLTYDRRRRAIEALRDRYPLRVFDAVEMDYDPRDAEEIRAFLDEAEFDYAVGSVHYIDDVNVHARPYFADRTSDERREAVERYFDTVVSLVESELFDVAAHLDLVERNPALRGFATRRQYGRVADALESSRTVPEVNAGRALGEYGEFHPSPALLDALVGRDVDFVAGSDAHEPGELGTRREALASRFEAAGVDPVRL